MTTILHGCNSAKGLSALQILSIPTQFWSSLPSLCQSPRDPAVRVFPDVGSTLISDVFTHLGEDRLRAPHRRKDRSCQMGSSTPPLRRRHRCPTHLQHCRTATTGAPHRRKDRSCQMGSSTPPLRRRHRCPTHLQHCRTATTGLLVT
ncbi:uncharacterized protein WM277_003416 isoform 4-T4 [Molossus nigricans]